MILESKYLDGIAEVDWALGWRDLAYTMSGGKKLIP